MSWKDEQIEKLKEASSLALTIIIDALLVILLFSVYDYVDSFISDNNSEDLKNKTITPVKTISSYFLIIVFGLYVLFDIATHIIRSYKKLRKDD